STTNSLSVHRRWHGSSVSSPLDMIEARRESRERSYHRTPIVVAWSSPPAVDFSTPGPLGPRGSSAPEGLTPRSGCGSGELPHSLDPKESPRGHLSDPRAT